MNFGPLSQEDLLGSLPYAILSAGSLLILLAVPFSRPGMRERLSAFLTGAVILGALVSFLWIGEGTLSFGGLLIHDRLGIGMALIVSLLFLLVLPAYPELRDNLAEGPSGFFSLLLLSLCGAFLLIFSNHLLVSFVGLELLSLPLYILTAINRSSRASSEAAFKYFLLGSVASALFIYGTAVIWGLVGTVRLDEIASAWANKDAGDPGLLAAGVGLVIAGIAFKVGLVPFHMWVPDVYEGAPAYVVAWMAGAVKAAGITLALRFVGVAIPPESLDTRAVFVFVSLASMVLGSLAALQQSGFKRLLAYSAVAHAGYAAIALVTVQSGLVRESYVGAGYYLLTYGIASLACFIVAAMEESEGRGSISDLSGLARRRPALAAVLAIALLSLAGFPPLAGFFGKFNLFSLAVRAGHMELVLVGVLTSVISLGYYLKVIVALYMQEPSEARVPELRFGTGLSLIAAALALVLFGLFPGWVLALL
ncbi:MAG: NADH-quinone oxidoreductase subunit N [Pseudomonadota bacterium]